MKSSELASRASAVFDRLQRSRPLIHHVTNFVVMNDTANVTLLVGASPVMAHALEEVEEMVAMSDALVLNPGTLSPQWVEAMLLAGRRARADGKPVVLDPVGAGATKYRTEVNLQLLAEVGPTIVRGNAGEIRALMGRSGGVRGVDSVDELDDVGAAVRGAARNWNCVVAVTGRRDFVSNGQRLVGIDNGHAWLTTLTGTGCMATSIIAAFAAVEADAFCATAAALACYGYAAELAAGDSEGPGSFKAALFDQLFNLTPERVEHGAQIVELE